MAKIYTSAAQMIGHTPLLELTEIEKQFDLKARLLAKLEYFNTTGSTKDRAALQMILDAEESGALHKGGTIIEPTSGNTGIGLASVGVSRGYRVIIVMPASMSVERRKLMKAYGAELVLSDGSQGMPGAIAEAEKLHQEMPGSWIAGQFTNPSNARAHYLTTGPEIYEDTDGQVDAVVAGVGSGGTITGIARYLKEKNPAIRAIAVEPAGSPVLSGGKAGKHAIQGIGAGFIPEVLDQSIVDAVVRVTDEDAIDTAKNFGRYTGTLVGISSGAAVWAGMEEAKKEEMAGKTIVVICPDSADRYLSTAMFAE